MTYFQAENQNVWNRVVSWYSGISLTCCYSFDDAMPNDDANLFGSKKQSICN